MERIWLDDNLNIKKLDPNDPKDVYLANQLDKDPLISGINGYLYPIDVTFNDIRYLFRDGLYQSPYGIYVQEKPVGFIELSDILVIKNKKTVDICYALLESERKKGYASKTLLEISKKILLDVQKISLLIDSSNIPSQNVAKRAGFVEDTFIHFDGLVGYQKTK